MGSGRSKVIFFSENGHAAYQIKENHECSHKVANTLPADSLDPGMGLIGQNSTFSEHGHVAYQFKENHKMKQQGSKYFVRRPLPPPPTLGMGSVGQNLTFLEHGHVAYSFKGNHEL